MSNVIVSYNGIETTIQCEKKDKMKDIINKYKNKSEIDINKIIFLYGGTKINLESTFNEIATNVDKTKNEMKILALNFQEESKDEGLIKSKNVICPQCKENCLLCMENYKIKLYDCKNGHITNNISLNEFNNIQKINENEIICKNCNETKFKSYKKLFYKCLDCKNNFCVMCREKHSQEHKTIDYNDINYKCLEHNDFYISYCNECKKNLCMKCEKKHDNNHNIIDYKNILPDEDEIKKELKSFKNKIDKLKGNVTEIINILNKVYENFEIYYKIIYDILYNYNTQQRNYEILQNLNSIKKYINLKDIDNILNENNGYKKKFYALFDLYNKMNSDMTNSKPESNDNTNKIDTNDQKQKEKAPAIGIHLGTCKSCIAVYQNGKVEIIPSDIGEKTIPSIVSFTDTKKLIGASAKTQMNKNPTNTIFNAKRLIGLNLENKEIQEEMKYWPFKLDPDSNRPQFQITYKNEQKKLYVEEILAMELQKIKEIASKYLGKEVEDAVISIPSSFTLHQRQMVKDAATISGLNVKNLVGESILASYKYYFNKTSLNREVNILVFYFGGGFLSVSVHSLEDGLFEVRGVKGNTHLGGEDFDNRLIDYCVKVFHDKTSINIMNNPKALRRLRTECEKAKKILSSAKNTTIEIEELIDGEDLVIEITRDKFEELCDDLFKKCIPVVENVLKDVKMSVYELYEIILIGGSTRIPKIKKLLQEFFKNKPINQSINSEETIAYGAAIEAAVRTNVKDDKIEKLILLDVFPNSIGIETSGGIMTPLFRGNFTIPTKKTQNFSTYEDNQTSVLIPIFEGDNKLTKDNHLIGKFNIDGIPPMPKGKAEIEVTFDFDTHLNLNVYAVEKSSGLSKNMIMNYQDKDLISRENLIKMTSEFNKKEDERNKVKEKYEKIFIDIKEKIEKILNWIKKMPYCSKEQIMAKKEELDDIINYEF